MQRDAVESIVRALDEASCRYLIAGGLAVVAHGYVRLTADLDLILDFPSDNLRRGLGALASLSYRPRAPVPIEEFADSGKRLAWIRDKNMNAFDDLIELKKRAGRPKDLDDIERLLQIREERRHG